MDTDERRKKAHELDVTVWVGKNGLETVVDELQNQLENGDGEMVKVKFLRAARGGTTTDELAEQLADMVDANLFETRGNTAVYYR